MDTNEYMVYWAKVEPLMRAKLEALKAELEGKTEYTLSDVYQRGDEEFMLTLDLRRGNVTVLGADFVLLDSAANGAAEGVGIKLNLTGYGALVLGDYAPGIYTDEAFTLDVDEVIFRVEQLEVAQLAAYIVDDALKNEVLLRELKNAD